MNLKRAMGRERRPEDAELNITPVMNMFLILVPFLLLTAVFVRIAVLELSLPSLKKDGTREQRPESAVLIILSVTEKGFELRAPNTKIPMIRRKGEEYDYDTLIRRLRELDRKFVGVDDVIISPAATIKYEVIVKVMDRCRENGFPNISISG
jgi:biopolymer transport protein ExbD